MKDTEDVQRLIRLKRYETPGEDYYESFVENLKDRQRAELLQRSSRSILAERFSLWFDELSAAKWLVPTGAAAAAIGAGIFLLPGTTGEDSLREGDSGIASSKIEQTTLPPFPESTDEVIRLQVPKAGIPTKTAQGPVLPASVRGSLREL